MNTGACPNPSVGSTPDSLPLASGSHRQVPSPLEAFSRFLERSREHSRSVSEEHKPANRRPPGVRSNLKPTPATDPSSVEAESSAAADTKTEKPTDPAREPDHSQIPPWLWEFSALPEFPPPPKLSLAQPDSLSNTAVPAQLSGAAAPAAPDTGSVHDGSDSNAEPLPPPSSSDAAVSDSAELLAALPHSEEGPSTDLAKMFPGKILPAPQLPPSSEAPKVVPAEKVTPDAFPAATSLDGGSIPGGIRVAPLEQEMKLSGQAQLLETESEQQPNDKLAWMLSEKAERLNGNNSLYPEAGPQAVASLTPAAGSALERFGAVHGVSPAATGVTPSENILLQITRHAVDCRQFKAESMAVVVKPDPETEIFLRLSLRDGGVDVYARLERGVAEILKAHWSEMQQSLQQQSIRLSPLAEPLFRQPPDDATADDQPGAGPDYPPHGESANPIPKTRTPARKRAPESGGLFNGRWQSWA